jgi:hypothetical protein
MSPIELWISLLALVLALAAALSGVVEPSVYRDAPVLLPQLFGQDLVTLLIGLPLLAGGLIAARSGSLRGRLIWLGGLGYLLYTYATYAFGARWNVLFLAYVALFGLALFGVIIGLLRTDPQAIRAGFGARPPARPAAAYFFTIAVLVGGLWLAEEIPATLAGAAPFFVIEADLTTNVIHVLDLAVIVPAFAVTGVLLLRDRPWGFVLAGMLSVKAATIGAAVLAMAWFSARKGIPVPIGQAAFFTLLTTLSAAVGWWFLRHLDPRIGGGGSVPLGMIGSSSDGRA